jgi:hypothetical protein
MRTLVIPAKAEIQKERLGCLVNPGKEISKETSGALH